MLPHIIATTVVVLVLVFSYQLGKSIKEPEGWLDTFLCTALGSLILLILIGSAGLIVYLYHLVLDSFVML
ncbi:hypothetical protein [Vibrio phage PJN101]|nr:hypothetical protein [Vibrio phage PJN101]